MNKKDIITFFVRISGIPKKLDSWKTHLKTEFEDSHAQHYKNFKDFKARAKHFIFADYMIPSL